MARDVTRARSQSSSPLRWSSPLQHRLTQPAVTVQVARRDRAGMLDAVAAARAAESGAQQLLGCGHHATLRNHVTADDLHAFIVKVRAEADAALARLATVDANTLPVDLRERWEESHRGWEDLRRLTADEVVALHEAACLQAGRELTAEELRGGGAAAVGVAPSRTSRPPGA